MYGWPLHGLIGRYGYPLSEPVVYSNYWAMSEIDTVRREVLLDIDDLDSVAECHGDLGRQRVAQHKLAGSVQSVGLAGNAPAAGAAANKQVPAKRVSDQGKTVASTFHSTINRALLPTAIPPPCAWRPAFPCVPAMLAN